MRAEGGGRGYTTSTKRNSNTFLEPLHIPDFQVFVLYVQEVVTHFICNLVYKTGHYFLDIWKAKITLEIFQKSRHIQCIL